MNKTIRGFTIIELLVIITVIGILSTIGFASFTTIQKEVRDTARSSQIELISKALEKYYLKNGEYPSCDAMTTGSVSSVANSLSIDVKLLASPSAAVNTNSITCDDPIADTFTYSSCNQFTYTLKYRKESSGEVVSVLSRNKSITATGGTISTADNITTHRFEYGINFNGIDNLFTTKQNGSVTVSIYGGGGGGGPGGTDSGNPGTAGTSGLIGGNTSVLYDSVAYTAFGGNGGGPATTNGYKGDKGVDGSANIYNGWSIDPNNIECHGNGGPGGEGGNYPDEWVIGGCGGAGGKLSRNLYVQKNNVFTVTGIGAGGAGGPVISGSGHDGIVGGNGYVTFSYQMCS